MRAGDAVRLGAIRMTIAALQSAEIAKRPAALDESERLQVVVKAVKARREAAEAFRKGDRPELAEKEEKEAAVLEAYLPKALSEAEVKALVAEAVRESGASSPKEMGKVMKAVMPKVAGRADGGVVNRLVREALGA